MGSNNSKLESTQPSSSSNNNNRSSARWFGTHAGVSSSCGISGGGAISAPEVKDSIETVITLLHGKFCRQGDNGWYITGAKRAQGQIDMPGKFYVHGFLMLQFEQEGFNDLTQERTVKVKFARIDWGADGLFVEFGDAERQCRKYERKLVSLSAEELELNFGRDEDAPLQKGDNYHPGGWHNVPSNDTAFKDLIKYLEEWAQNPKVYNFWNFNCNHAADKLAEVVMNGTRI